MTASLAREIGLLRRITRNLVSGPTAQIALAARRVAAGVSGGQRLVAILRPGHEAFADLSAEIIARFPAMGRGADFAVFEGELLRYVTDHFVGCDPATLGSSEVSALLEHFENWFRSAAYPCTVFVPCVISPWQAPRFSIGPIDFVFIDDVAGSEFYPRQGDSNDVSARMGVDKMLHLMRETRAHWLACAQVDGCEQHRAQEIGSLAVDLAIVGVQLAAPNAGTRTMSRLDSRRGAPDKFTVSKAGRDYNAAWSKMDAGMTVGPGVLADIFRQCNQLIEAVGNCVRSFASGQFRFTTLEQAWCDAAYWLHDALAEPMVIFGS